MRRLRKLEWPLVAVLGVIALALGSIGWAAYDARNGTWDDLYLSWQLFRLQSGGVPGPLPWTLEVARFLAPAIAAYAIIRALAATLFRRHIEALRARRSHDHVVVCGLGDLGLYVVQGLRARNERVVAIEADDTNANIALSRSAGALVIVGEASEQATLRSAGAGRAGRVVIVGDDDRTNADTALAVRAVAGDRALALPCLVHLREQQLCTMLTVYEFRRRRPSAVRLECFNVFEAGARALLDKYPPGAETVVVGLGKIGRAILLHLAESQRDPASVERISVLCPDADLQLAGFATRHLELAGLDLVTESVELDAPGLASAPSIARLGAAVTGAVYVCSDDESTNVATALALRDHVPGDVPIVVGVARRGGVGALLESNPEMRVHVFGVLDHTADPDVLFDGPGERLARSLHAEYVRHEQDEGNTVADNPSMAPWESLPPALKESNRTHASGIGGKLHAIGCEIVPHVGATDGPPVQLTTDEVEMLAEFEHERWIDERRAAGWQEGDRDAERKTTPYLVPWSALDDDIKEYDRLFVRALPVVVTSAGLQIVRVSDIDRVRNAAATPR